MKKQLEQICDALTERREQLREQGVNGEYVNDHTYQTLLRAYNREQIKEEPKAQYEEFVDLVSSVGGELS